MVSPKFVATKFIPILFAGLLLWGWGSSALAQEREEIKKKINKILQDTRYQKKELKGEEEPQKPRKASSPGPLLHLPSLFLGPFWYALFRFVFYFVCFLILLALFFFLFRRVYENYSGTSRAKSREEKGVLPGGSSSTGLDRPHQELAQEGLYLEAIRQIFKKALELVMGRGLFKGNLSWTNREILGFLKNDPALYQLLGEMAQVIERGYYARKLLSIQDYNTCLENYQRLQRKIS